jgi:Putative peptidoglycan binding domain/Caspase domain
MRIIAASCLVSAGLLLAPDVRAEPPGAALVIGNATYSSLPAIPACARSAHAVAAALGALGFTLTEREDASSGSIDAGISEFAKHLADDHGAAVIYVCAYGTSFNNRPFLLPTTANIARPSDALTQGVLLKALVDTLKASTITAAVVALDLVPKPDGSAQLGLEALADIPVSDGVGVLATTEAPTSDAPTPVAAALVAGLAGPAVRSQDLLAGMQAKLAGSKAIVAALHMPVRADYLAGAPPQPPPPAPAKPPPAPPVAVVTPVLPPAPQPPPMPLVQLPDDAQMTDADRRKVQGVLLRLGYYDLPVDGVFGPETRAAIRRYQHEIGAEMTGRLTAAQASRLVSTR